jgi:hypothetical protein
MPVWCFWVIVGLKAELKSHRVVHSATPYEIDFIKFVFENYDLDEYK